MRFFALLKMTSSRFIFCRGGTGVSALKRTEYNTVGASLVGVQKENRVQITEYRFRRGTPCGRPKEYNIVGAVPACPP